MTASAISPGLIDTEMSFRTKDSIPTDAMIKVEDVVRLRRPTASTGRSSHHRDDPVADPVVGRWGRIVEGAGEDPVLAAAVAAAQVRGFQGDLGSDRVIAGPKHFAGYGAARGGRDYDEADVSKKRLSVSAACSK